VKAKPQKSSIEEKKGIPQGSPLSPVVANVVLTGIETAVQDSCKNYLDGKDGQRKR